jgi:hypothetical protein
MLTFPNAVRASQVLRIGRQAAAALGDGFARLSKGMDLKNPRGGGVEDSLDPAESYCMRYRPAARRPQMTQASH